VQATMHFAAPLSSLASALFFAYAQASYLNNELSFGHNGKYVFLLPVLLLSFTHHFKHFPKSTKHPQFPTAWQARGTRDPLQQAGPDPASAREPTRSSLGREAPPTLRMDSRCRFSSNRSRTRWGKSTNMVCEVWERRSGNS